MSIAVRWTATDDRPALDRFVARHYAPGHPLRDPEYFRFWFQRATVNPTVVIAVKDTDVVGIQGLIRSEITWQGKDCQVDWYCNTFVEPAYRNRGLGLRLLAFTTECSRNLLTLSYTDAAGALLRRLGFSFYESAALLRYVRILNGEVYDRLPNVGRSRPTALAVQAAPSPVERATSATASLERSWAQFAATYGMTTTHTVDAIATRYFRHPKYDYHVLRTAEYTACCAVRFEPQGSPLVARIVDCWGDPGEAPGLFTAAAEYAAARGAGFVDFHASSTILQDALAQAGYQRLEGDARWDVPYLFGPPARRGHYNERFAARLTDVPLPDPDPSSIYFVKADGDRDR